MQVSWVAPLTGFRVEDNIIAEAVVDTAPAGHGLLPRLHPGWKLRFGTSILLPLAIK